MRPEEIFLSHASADRPFASRLAEVIRRHGIPVWYSETEILGAIIDFRKDEEAGLRELFRTWGIGYQPVTDREQE